MIDICIFAPERGSMNSFGAEECDNGRSSAIWHPDCSQGTYLTVMHVYRFGGGSVVVIQAVEVPCAGQD